MIHRPRTARARSVRQAFCFLPPPAPSANWTASAGGIYRSFAGLPTYGGELSLGGDFYQHKPAVHIEGRYAYAQSPHGLPFHSVHFAGLVGPAFRPLRLGFVGGLGFDAVGRSTAGPPLTRVTLGISGVVTIDLATFGSSKILVGTRGDLDLPNIILLMTRGAVVPGASAFAGVRF